MKNYNDNYFSLSRKNKKAFGDAASTLILFIAIITVTTGVVIVFKNFVASTQDSFSTQSDVVNNKLKTIISISNVYYNTSSNISYIYVKNIGETKLRPTSFDLFIDDLYYDDYSVFYANNLSKNITLFQTQETLAIVKNINLSSGTHEVKVVTEYSSSAEDSFNI